MRSYKEIVCVIAILLLCSTCSMTTSFEIINFSEDEIYISYTIDYSVENGLFDRYRLNDDSLPRVYEVIADTRNTHDEEWKLSQNQPILEDSVSVEIKLMPLEKVVIAEKRGPYEKHDKSSTYYKDFNLTELKIWNKTDTIKCNGELIKILLQEITETRYGIILK